MLREKSHNVIKKVLSLPPIIPSVYVKTGNDALTLYRGKLQSKYLAIVIYYPKTIRTCSSCSIFSIFFVSFVISQLVLLLFLWFWACVLHRHVCSCFFNKIVDLASCMVTMRFKHENVLHREPHMRFSLVESLSLHSAWSSWGMTIYKYMRKSCLVCFVTFLNGIVNGKIQLCPVCTQRYMYMYQLKVFFSAIFKSN